MWELGGVMGFIRGLRKIKLHEGDPCLLPANQKYNFCNFLKNHGF